jgi:hypothetical protein
VHNNQGNLSQQVNPVKPFHFSGARVISTVQNTNTHTSPPAAPKVPFVTGSADPNTMHAKATTKNTILEVIDEFHPRAKGQR